jgi:hypothetical protein
VWPVAAPLVHPARRLLTDMKIIMGLHPVQGLDPDWPDWIEVPAVESCYMCSAEAGHGMDDESARAFPRNIVEEKTIDLRRDPTQAFRLSCGHVII